MGKNIDKNLIEEGLNILKSENISIIKTAKKIGIGRKSLSNGLKKYFPIEAKKFCKDENKIKYNYTDKEINDFYNEMKNLNLSLTKYCEFKKIDSTGFSKRCKKLNLEILSNCNKKDINEKYFDIINESNSYWLGLLAADGSVCKHGEYCYYLELNLIDKDHIEKFKKCIESDHKVTKKIVKSNGSEGYRITIGNNYLAKRLIDLGIIPNKTYSKIEIPEEIKNDKKLFISYLRGFFDGDGDISLNYEKLGHVGFSSYDSETLKDLNNLINKYLNLNFSLYKSENRCYSLRLHGKDNMKKFLSTLYDNVNSDYYLNRKYEKYKNYTAV